MLTTPARYRIRVQGQLGPQWADWFGGFTLSWEEPGETVFVGQIIDQAALHGILNAIREPSSALARSPTPGARGRFGSGPISRLYTHCYSTRRASFAWACRCPARRGRAENGRRAS
jgi:hypothetical protein